MPGIGSNSTGGVTPGRATSVEFDVGGPSLTRPPWALTRRGHEIGRGVPLGSGGSANVMLMTSGAWGLQPYQQQYTYDRTVTQAGILRASSWNLAPGVKEAPFHRKEEGVTYNPGVAESGDHFLMKTRAQSTSWDQGLSADAAAFPGPTLSDTSVPVVRVASGRETHPANQGYHLRVQAPGVKLQPQDHFFSFHFGGPTELEEGGAQSAGEMSLSLFGGGEARLLERIDAVWQPIRKFFFAPPGRVAGALHNLFVTPEGPSVLGMNTGAPDQGGNLVVSGTPSYPPPPPALHQQAIPRHPTTPKKNHYTGAGTPRVDQRPDLRIPWQVSVLRYPASGVLVDGVFAVSSGFLPAGTKLFLNYQAWAPAGTTVSAELRDATTHAPLAQNGDGTWASNAGQNRYYARFTLTGPGTTTPLLYAFEVYAQGYRIERETTPLTGGTLRRVDVTGPDLDPSHESASLEITDPLNALSALRARSGLRTRVRVSGVDPANPAETSVLFEGVMARASARRKGRAANAGLGGSGASRVYPSPLWHQYSVSLVGQWARLARQLAFTGKDFATDLTATPNANGQYPPWKATDAIRWMLEQAGATSDQIDVPDLPVRLFVGTGDSAEFLLQSTGSFAEYIQKLAKDYLGGFVVWDANAGTRGMWRLILAPTPPYNVLWGFTTTPAVGRITGNANAYGANTTFIRDLETWVKPPEANLVVVTGTGELGSYGDPTSLVRYAHNPKSFSFNQDNPTADPSHPDYTDGEIVPLVYFDVTLKTPEALSFICRRLADQTIYSQKWARFEAPMVFVEDAADTQLAGKRRPLRVYDAITINGHEALVRSAQYGWERDHLQMMRLECLFTDNTLVLGA